MGNKIELLNININKGKIEYEYNVEGEWSKYFNENSFYVDYDIELSKLPYSVAAIPFISNIIALSWMFDAEIFLDSIDYDFIVSSEKIRSEFIKMYPSLHFGIASIHSDVVINNNKKDVNTRSAALFSGGADAHFTLLRNIDEKPLLITYQWRNEKQNKIKQRSKSTAKIFDCNSVCADTNIKTFLNNNNLDNIVKSTENTYWHKIQHGMGLLGLSAPVLYLNNIVKIYIASSYSISSEIVPCASNPITDNMFKFCGVTVKHDGAEFKRQDKINHICEIADLNKTHIILGVCAHSKDNKINCNKCMKCQRTILQIIAEGYDPNHFGFSHDKSTAKKIKFNLKYKNFIAEKRVEEYYIPIKQRFLMNKNVIDNYHQYKWIEKIDMKKINSGKIKRLINFLRKSKRYFLSSNYNKI